MARLILFLVLTFGASSFEQYNEANFKDFKLPNKHNVLVNTKNYRGAYVLVYFWNSSCKSCSQDFPAMTAVLDRFKTKHYKIANKGFKIIGVSTDKNKNMWRKALEKNNFKWDNVIDQDGLAGYALKMNKVTQIPANILIDKGGYIIARDVSIKEVETILSRNLK